MRPLLVACILINTESITKNSGQILDSKSNISFVELQFIPLYLEKNSKSITNNLGKISDSKLKTRDYSKPKSILIRVHHLKCRPQRANHPTYMTKLWCNTLLYTITNSQTCSSNNHVRYT